jgi:hypothetical protein
MMIFNNATSYFNKNSFHYFEDYLMMKLTLGNGIDTLGLAIQAASGQLPS